MVQADVETVLQADLSEEDRALLNQLSAAVYPPEVLAAFDIPASAPAPEIDWPEARRSRRFLIRRDGRIVATSLLLPRRIRTPRGLMDVLALASVKTHPDLRHKGLGRAVVQAAFACVDDGAFPLSLFQTGVPEFYEKLGARQVENPFVNSLGQDPRRRPWWDKVAMIYPTDAHWPDGEIDLLGPGW